MQTVAETQKQEEPETQPASNLERLQRHLDKESLAGKLVAARIAVGNGDARAAVQQVVLDRLQELKQKHGSVPD